MLGLGVAGGNRNSSIPNRSMDLIPSLFTFLALLCLFCLGLMAYRPYSS